jgi:hypothetical protein
MKKLSFICGAFLAGLVNSSFIQAGNAILSGEISGDEPLAPAPSFCGVSEGIPHHLLGPIRVGSSGTYYIVDGSLSLRFYTGVGSDTTASVYQGSYDINNPNANLVGVMDDIDAVTLNAGTDYYFVIQPFCSDFPGVYATTISGPGDITGDDANAPYEFMEGTFTNSDPVGDITEQQCGDTVYNVSAPFQVDWSGPHYYADISRDISDIAAGYVDLSATFYDGPFDPDNPAANRLGSLDDGGIIQLEKGIEYRVVTQPYCDNQNDRGEWFFILLPSRGLPNHALSGAWFNQATSGQGILMEIYERSEFVFLAWFTYDTSQPDPDVPFNVGHSGHRWLTAQGNYQPGSKTITIPVFLVWGGIFDDPTAVENMPDGSITVEFHDCKNATVSYQLTASGESGSFTMIRILNDNASYCSTTADSLTAFEN